jgi:AmiR/NasT family two-component response regulator
MERQKRVLVANRPKLMREIVIEACAGQADIEIVGEVAEDCDIMSRIDETQPDFLFIALEDPDKRPPICDAILRLRPKLGIIAVGAHSNRTVKY